MTINLYLLQKKMKRLSLLCFSYLFVHSIFAQTFNGTTGNIADDGSIVTFEANVAKLNSSVLDATYGLVEVCVDITHTWVSDLEMILVAPDGTQVTLSNQNGGDGDDYQNTCFNMEATIPIQGGNPPYTGQYIPEDDFADINNGQDGNGTWYLAFEDHYPGADAGVLLSWSISFGAGPPPPVQFESSNLPLVFIETNGQTINDDTQVISDFGIVDNGAGNRNYFTDPRNDFDGHAKIKYRGQSSLGFDKKGYSIELSNALGNDIEASLLGFPSEEDWILHGPYSDKTCIRNDLSMKVARELGWYSSRTKHVELFVNDDYQGLYVVMEKIKRGEGRLDIAKLNSDDIDGDQLTGGYILKIDKDDDGGWLSDYNIANSNDKLYIQHEYPKADDLEPEQLEYIKNYVREFEEALASSDFTNSLGKNYKEYINVGSFVDYFILSEISKNVDAYRLSTYFHKDKDSKGGKLTMGPYWDFNLAWFNADYCDADLSAGWIFEENCGQGNPFWWQRLIADPVFRNTLRCRWDELRGSILDVNYLNNYIDAKALELDESQMRNFERWPILGTYVWPNPFVPSTYQGEINNLKNWMQSRIDWMDFQINNFEGGEIQTTLNITSCGDYTSPSGAVYNTSGTYNDSVINAEGCDSTFIIYLEIQELDVSVTETDTDLIANATGVEYQWLDCNNNFQPLNGATTQGVYPFIDGLFAVQITDGDCVGVSECYPFFSVGTDDQDWAKDFVVAPNPTTGNISINLFENYNELNISIRNVMGQLISENKYENKSQIDLNITGANGMYLIEVVSENKTATFKVLKK